MKSYKFIFLPLLCTFMLLVGCKQGSTLPAPNTPATAGLEAMAAYGIAASGVAEYIGYPVCTSPATVLPCKTPSIAAKLKLADATAYSAALAAFNAGSDVAKANAAAAATSQLKTAKAEAGVK